MDNQLYTSAALYMGAALITATSITSTFLPHAGMTPTLIILIIFLAVSFSLSKKVTNLKGKISLAISGVLSALLCHFILTYLNNYTL